MTDIGPVQMLTVGFGPDATFEGRIIEELTALELDGTIRVLDLLFVRAGNRMGMRQGYRTMARMQRRRSFDMAVPPMASTRSA